MNVKGCLPFSKSYRPCTIVRKTEFQEEMIPGDDCVHCYDILMGIQQQFQVEIKAHSPFHALHLQNGWLEAVLN